jgi:DNA-binding XRE family transcriptional regulator
MAELEDRFRAARAYAGYNQTRFGAAAGGLTKDAVINYENGKFRNDHDRDSVITAYARTCEIAEAWFTADWDQLEAEHPMPEDEMARLTSVVEELNERLSGTEQRIEERVDHEQFVHAVDLLQKAIESLDQQLTRGRKAA